MRRPTLRSKNKATACHEFFAALKWYSSPGPVMAREFADDGTAVNCLWPRTTIATAAIKFNFPAGIYNASRHPEIMTGAAYQIFLRDSRVHSGNFYVDEEVLKMVGQTDFEQYAVSLSVAEQTDFFLGERR